MIFLLTIGSLIAAARTASNEERRRLERKALLQFALSGRSILLDSDPEAVLRFLGISQVDPELWALAKKVAVLTEQNMDRLVAAAVPEILEGTPPETDLSIRGVELQAFKGYRLISPLSRKAELWSEGRETDDLSETFRKHSPDDEIDAAILRPDGSVLASIILASRSGLTGPWEQGALRLRELYFPGSAPTQADREAMRNLLASFSLPRELGRLSLTDLKRPEFPVEPETPLRVRVDHFAEMALDHPEWDYLLSFPWSFWLDHQDQIPEDERVSALLDYLVMSAEENCPPWISLAVDIGVHRACIQLQDADQKAEVFVGLGLARPYSDDGEIDLLVAISESRALGSGRRHSHWAFQAPDDQAVIALPPMSWDTRRGAFFDFLKSITPIPHEPLGDGVLRVPNVPDALDFIGRRMRLAATTFE